MRAVRELGVDVERPRRGDGRRATGSASTARGARRATLDMGNAGTAMRLFMGLLAAQPFDSELVGDASLMRRPMERVAKPLREMGARIETLDGKPPVRIARRCRAARHPLRDAGRERAGEVRGAARGTLRARARRRSRSRPSTRDHTERMLQSFGCEVSAARRRGHVAAAAASYEAASIERAGRFLVGGVLHRRRLHRRARRLFTIRGVGVNPTRTGLLEMLALMGADLRLINHRSCGAEPVADIEVRPATLRGVRVPERLVPLAIDEFPVFFIAAACAEGETLVTGAEELRVKESDRIAVMARGLAALGVRTRCSPDGLRIEGGRIGGGTVDSRGDHRIAMSFAVASLPRRGADRDPGRGERRDVVPGLCRLAHSVGLRIEERA